MESQDLMELLLTRRTYRRFDQSRPVPEEVAADILRAQQYASRGNNRQPLRFLLIRTPELVEQVFPLTRWAASLPPEAGTPKPGEHPTLFLAVLEERRLQNRWTDTDAGLAIANMTLAAWAHGVGSCILGNINRDALRTLLQISQDYELHTLVAFGYPTHRSYLEEVGPDADLRYHLDEKGDYLVPRRRIADVADQI